MLFRKVDERNIKKINSRLKKFKGRHFRLLNRLESNLLKKEAETNNLDIIGQAQETLKLLFISEYSLIRGVSSALYSKISGDIKDTIFNGSNMGLVINEDDVKVNYDLKDVNIFEYGGFVNSGNKVVDYFWRNSFGNLENVVMFSEGVLTASKIKSNRAKNVAIGLSAERLRSMSIGYNAKHLESVRIGLGTDELEYVSVGKGAKFIKEVVVGGVFNNRKTKLISYSSLGTGSGRVNNSAFSAVNLRHVHLGTRGGNVEHCVMGVESKEVSYCSIGSFARNVSGTLGRSAYRISNSSVGNESKFARSCSLGNKAKVIVNSTIGRNGAGVYSAFLGAEAESISGCSIGENAKLIEYAQLGLGAKSVNDSSVGYNAMMKTDIITGAGKRNY